VMVLVLAQDPVREQSLVLALEHHLGAQPRDPVRERHVVHETSPREAQLQRTAARPKRVFVGGRTADEPYAGYVERVRGRIVATARDVIARSGQVALVSLFIGADGGLQNVEFDRTSSNPAFDRRVRAAARDAAPFPPLPPSVRERADVLVITFQFPDT